MLRIIWNILLLSVIIFVVAQLMPGIRLKNFATAILVAVVYSVINFLLFKILAFLAFPLIFVTFGLFVFIINAALLWLTDQLIEDFEIKGIGTTLIAAVLITLGNMLLKWIF
ncbi:MAG: phage holin family protein [bacterium]